MVSFANQQNIYTITSTNAHYLTPENAKQTVLSKLDKLIISVDGITQEVYEQYRIGGHLDKVISGTKEILKQKKLLKSKTPHVVWQFVVFKPNEGQIQAVKELGKELGGWVSLHHGGGVGIGYSQHAGMVIVADGTPEAAKRLERVLWNDPASGVMRHADAGYEEAIACAKEYHLNLPSLG